MRKCFTPWVENTYQKKKGSDLKQIYCVGPCRVLPDFCKMCSAMTMASCPSSPMSLRQLLNLLKRINLPSWQNTIFVSQSPGSFWQLSAMGAAVLREGQPKAGHVSPRTQHGVSTSQVTGTGISHVPTHLHWKISVLLYKSRGQLSCTISMRAQCWRHISSKSRCTRSLHGKMSILRWFPSCSSVKSDAICGKRLSLGL